MAGTVRPGREDERTSASARVECGDACGTGARVGGRERATRNENGQGIYACLCVEERATGGGGGDAGGKQRSAGISVRQVEGKARGWQQRRTDGGGDVAGRHSGPTR